jgi:hypothetical protein
MKLELLVITITFFFIYNTWYDNKMINIFHHWKKHIKIAGIIFAAFMFYFVMKKKTFDKNLLLYTNEFIKYLPVDKSNINAFSPIFDLTSTHQDDFFMNELNPQQKKMANSQGGRKPLITGNKTKRVVSETKKKFVASNQDWKCGKCHNKLNAWFEVDHKVRLEYGGSNEVDNLIALCRECHGSKTAMENM